MARSKGVARVRRGLFEGSLDVDIDRDGQLAVKVRPMFRRELNKILREIKEEARQDVQRRHFRTGKLMRSIQVGKIKKVAGGQRISGTVTAGSSRAPYAYYVHEGSNAKLIVAKPGKVFAFPWTGRTGRVAVTRVGRNRHGRTVTRTRWERGPISDKDVVVDQYKRPAIRRDRFLNVAAAKTVAKYGGRISLPRG